MVRVFLYVRSQGSSITWLFCHVADMERSFRYMRSEGSSTTGQTWWGYFFMWDLNALLTRCRQGKGFSLREISRLFYHAWQTWWRFGLKAFLLSGRQGEGFSVRSQGTSTTWQTWWGFFFMWYLKALPPRGRHSEGFFMWDLNALLPRGSHSEGFSFRCDPEVILLPGRHGEGFSLNEISMLFYHVADMVRVLLYVRSQGSSSTWKTWWGF